MVGSAGSNRARHRWQPALITSINDDQALAFPSELHWPSRDDIAALIAALEASLPQGDPLVVTPGDFR
jgi:hypothetical protein